MHTLRAAHRRYTIEFSAAMLTYMVVLFGSVTLLGRLGDTALALSLSSCSRAAGARPIAGLRALLPTNG
jgi:hypothetical protein